MSRSTPWGSAQQVTNHLRGFSTVHTAGHGGMMVSRGAAEKYLSDAARKRALKHGDYYCYEEDCDYLIPLFDTKELRSPLMSDYSFWNNKTDDEIEGWLIESLSSWHPDYLIEKGIEPAAEPYKKWCLRRDADKARADRSPNLVVSCLSESNTLNSTFIKVITADRKEHYVTKASYSKIQADKYKSIFMTLDCLVKVNPNDYPVMEDRLTQYAQDISKPYLEQIKNKTNEAVKEADGEFYGPRARFNGSMKSAKAALLNHLLKKGLIQEEADILIRKKLAEAQALVHQEFKFCSVFQ